MSLEERDASAEHPAGDARAVVSAGDARDEPSGAAAGDPSDDARGGLADAGTGTDGHHAEPADTELADTDPGDPDHRDRHAEVAEQLAEIEAAPLQERAERYGHLHEQLTRALDESD